MAVDSAHTIAFFRLPSLSAPLAFVEDGGELLIMSTMTAYALHLAVRGSIPPVGLRSLLFGDRPTAAASLT